MGGGQEKCRYHSTERAHRYRQPLHTPLTRPVQKHTLFKTLNGEIVYPV